MYCHRCGKKIDDTIRYCNYCGQKVDIKEKLEFNNNPIRNNTLNLGIKIIACFGALLFIVIGIIILGNDDNNKPTDAEDMFTNDLGYEASNNDMENNETNDESESTSGINAAVYDMDESILGTSLYDNYNLDKEGLDFPQKAQVYNMIFDKGMLFPDAAKVLEDNGFDCSANMNKLYTRTECVDFVFDVDGVESFLLRFDNKTGDIATIDKFELAEIKIKGGNTQWFNSYGFGSNGKNVPNLSSMRNNLDGYNISYKVGNYDSDNLKIELKKYYKWSYKSKFIFDRNSGECIMTDWDNGKNLFKP